MKRFMLALLAVALTLSVSAQTSRPARAPTTSQDAWWANAVFYQVFVRSFQDSDGDGIGDFKGLTSRLDYLKDLGVTGLWLMPIFPSPSYHGYDVTDYTGVNKQYGTPEDFDAFLRAAHERGIRVILDWVPNHTSREHPWFFESRNPASAKRDWYLWRKDNPGWPQPWGGGRTWHALDGQFYYGAFWDGMPDLNWRNEGVQAALDEAARGWLERGVDGFRVDAVRYMLEAPDNNRPDNDETIAWFERFSSMVKAAKPDATVVGEIWTGTDTVGSYLKGGAADNLAFDFELQAALLKTVQSARPGDAQLALEKVGRAYPPAAVDAIFISNHDMPRPKYFGAHKARAAASLLLTMPGTPFVYYGEEIGLPNGPSGDDRDKRNPMRWDDSAGAGFTTGSPWQRFSSDDAKITVKAQLETGGSLLNHYRNLIKLRQSRPALRVGGYASIGAGERLFAFSRTLGAENLVVVVNLDSDPGKAVMDLSALPKGAVRELTRGKTLAPLTEANAKRYALNLIGGGMVVLEVGAP